jgi:hypothetical protein
LGKSRSTQLNRRLKRGSVMPSVKTMATFASLAAIASWIFAFSWAGLALLAFDDVF